MYNKGIGTKELEMFAEMKAAGLSKMDMFFEVLGGVTVFALPISLMFLSEMF